MAQFFEFVGNHPLLFLIFFAVLGALIWNLMADFRTGGSSLTPPAVTLLINREDAVVIDVREENEYVQGHILNALHIPLSSLKDKLKSLERYREQALVVVCLSGARSATAGHTLRNNGFTKVYNLSGGMMAWQNAGMPITKGKEKASRVAV